VKETIHHTLKTVFGFHQFRAPQQEVIERVVACEDVFLVMPTGGGKSLCYQIPALHRPGLAIVVSPLISLMKDQVDALLDNGVRAACFNSSLSAAEANAVSRQMEKGELDLLYVAPERLMQPEFLERLSTLNLALFAIDEAHCISQWGHDFRPDYVQIGRLRGLFPTVPIVAMTATADPETRKDIIRQLGIGRATVYVAGFDRPNITYTVLPKSKPFAQLGEFLNGRRDEAGIIYALSRKRVEQVAERLNGAGFTAAAYHAGLPDDERRRVQDAFRRDDIRIVVATVAFGMGIDKPNVRFVVHYDMPKSVESYYQITGRAGRDGLPSEALMLFGMSDVMTARSLIENSDNPERVRIELQKLNAMVSYAEALTCRRRALLAYFGDQRDHDCGNCDICTDPPRRFDASEQAKKALSCVYRVGERFGARHVIDVLRGAKGQRILDLHHNELSTYGIGADLPSAEWDNIFRQLIHLGYLVQDFTRFGALGLTPSARPVLKGETQVILGQPRAVAKTEGKTRRKGGAGEGAHRDLFDELRTLRKQIADTAGVPPFVVFSDATLLEMSKNKPRDERDLLAITGIGEHKMRKYGASFLGAVDDYRRRTQSASEPGDLVLTLSDTQRETYRLYQQELSLAEMASQRGLKELTVVSHLEEIAATGVDIDLLRFVDADKLPLIDARLEVLGAVGLTALKAGLPDSISYMDIRLARGAFAKQHNQPDHQQV
jgi:ATP-dependent DNA helicase RecQ